MRLIIAFIAFIAISTLSAFILQLLNKLGFVEWVQVHGNKFFHKMFSCWFCLSWWINVAVCILIALTLHNWQFLVLPFFTTPVTKILL